MTSGCGARKEYAVERLEIDRDSWDTLRVDAAFAIRRAIGRPAIIEPEELSVLAFDEAYDTLFAGDTTIFPIPDASLGNREGIVVEVCGEFSGGRICEQEAIRASPKRLTVAETIRYPIDDNFTQGRFELDVSVERERMDGEGWEQVPFDGDVTGFLEAFVEGAPEASVRVPFARPTGTFDLARHPSYNDFRFYLDSQLMDESEAQVNFLVFAGIDDDPELRGRSEHHISPVTDEERLANVQGFARQVAEHLIDELASFLGGRRATFHIASWNYDRESDRYEIDMGMRWRGSFFDNRAYEIEGQLEVNEDGSNASFQMLDGNRRGIERWDRRLGRDQVMFRRLDVEQPTSRYRPGLRQRISY